MDWTVTYQTPEELRAAFPGVPEARYRPLTAWWWSAEAITEERMLWQLNRIAELGCGGFDITGLAMHGPAAGTVGDDPEGLSDEWYRLYRLACEKGRELGLGVSSWSPMQIGGPLDLPKAARERPEFLGEEVLTKGELDVRAYGFDYGNPEAIASVTGPDSAAGEFVERLGDLFGDNIIGFFEDEFPGFPRWSRDFAADFREAKGYDFPLEAFDQDIGPRTPAYRVDLFDVAAERVMRGYTRYQTELVNKHHFLAGYDECSRKGNPIATTLFYLDQFRTMSWATAPGTDQMGDARFSMSLADIHGSPRVWLEGFHSHGWGMSLEDQSRLLFEWGREGATLFLPHGMYYANRALWWEWAPPEIGWNQPYARHYRPFADMVGRLFSALSAGKHVPEVAVLYPQTTVWADSIGSRSWGPAAEEAEQCYLAIFGEHGIASGQDLERAVKPSLLAEAGYDRITVDEPHLSLFDIPVILPACRCLYSATVEQLIGDARDGRCVVIVEPVPQWSAENGREDAKFDALVAELRSVATVVSTPEEAIAALPRPRIEGLKSLWRRVGDLDLVFITGSGTARLHDMATRRPEIWDPISGAIKPFPAIIDGADLLLECEGPATLLSLAIGSPEAPKAVELREVELPEVWECEYLPWGENRWGDYRLPANDGTPPVERRTFAFREGDDPAWQAAPITPEDVEQPTFDLGFEDRMWGRTGRVAPTERHLGDGWREVVSTYGPKGTLEDGTLIEYSERLGVEDVALRTQIGLKGKVETVKVDLGEERTAGTVRSFVRVDEAASTHLVVEGSGVATLRLDGRHLIGPIECGVIAIPVEIEKGWHELEIDVEARAVTPSLSAVYRRHPTIRLAWVLSTPYRREPTGVWSWQIIYPDLKGDPGPKRFRRKVRVSEPTEVHTSFRASAAIESSIPQTLEPGEHFLEVRVARTDFGPFLNGEIRLSSPSGLSTIGTDFSWEIMEKDGEWRGVFEVGMAGSWMGSPDDEEPVDDTRRHVLTDVAWLEGEDVMSGQIPQLWADSPTDPPPAWFAFTAPPGARAMTLPIVGEVSAWSNGERVSVVDAVLPLTEGARVALRVQAPAGFRGAACFREHPLFELGPGHIRTGLSWHRQGLDVFAGVVLHRARVELEAPAEGEIDFGRVRGSVQVFVNGESQGVVFCAPWRAEILLRAGENVIELEVTNTLGSLAGRGIPTPFGPEDQRFGGLLEVPRLRVKV